MNLFRKRKQYRVPVRSIEQLSAKLVMENGRVLEASVLDTSAGGLGVAIEGERKSLLIEEGMELEVRTFSRDTLRGVRMMCTLANLSQVGNTTRCGLTFVDPEDVYGQLNADWWRYFNRREYRRAHPAPLELKVIGGGTVRKAITVDLSKTGFGMRLGVEVAVGDPLRIGFELPGSDRHYSVTGNVVHSTSVGASTQVGIAFDESRSPGFDDTQAAIEDLVAATLA